MKSIGTWWVMQTVSRTGGPSKKSKQITQECTKLARVRWKMLAQWKEDGYKQTRRLGCLLETVSLDCL